MLKKIKEIANAEKMRHQRNSFKLKYESQQEELIESKDEIIKLQKQLIATGNDKYKKILEKLSDIELKLEKGGKKNGNKVKEK